MTSEVADSAHTMAEGSSSSPLSQTWQIIESRGIGKGKRHEITQNGLQIGRIATADIIVLSGTVNEHHAVIEWDSLREVYTVRDLNTRNGTFLNQQLLRDSAKPIERGDSLRFGYDTDQVFRVEVLEHSTSLPSRPITGDPSSSVPPCTSGPSSSPRLPEVVPIAAPISPIHCVPVPAHALVVPVTSIQTCISPTHQSGPMTIMTPVTMATVVPMATVSHIVTTTQSIPTVNDSITSSSSDPAITQTKQTKDKQTNKDLLRVRIDGRKSVPAQVKGSPLYGVPSWWGEDDSNNEEEQPLKRSVAGRGRRNRLLIDEDRQMPYSDSELIPKKSGSLILREFDDDSGIAKKTPKKHIRKRESSVKTDKNSESWELESWESLVDTEPRPLSNNDRSTSFTIEFEQPQRKKKPPPSFILKQQQRPASVASELSSIEKSSKPPKIPEKKRNVAMVTPTRKYTKKNDKSATVNNSLVSTKPSREPKGGLNRPIATPIATPIYTPIATPIYTPIDTPMDTPMDTPHDVRLSDTIVLNDKKSDKTFTLSESTIPAVQRHHDAVLGLLQDITKTDLQSQSEVLVPPTKAHSQPSSLQSTPYAASEPGSRPGSARKQWRIENEIPHNLIMASIETRMSRLAETAQKTADNVRCVIDSAKRDGHVLDQAGVVDAIPTASNLPLWKIVNKEYQSICKYLIGVEKSLKDINMIIATDGNSSEDQVDSGKSQQQFEDSIEKDGSSLFDVIEEDEDKEEVMESASIDPLTDGEGTETEDSNEIIRIEMNLDYDGDDDSDTRSVMSSSDDEYFSLSSDPDQ